LPRSRRGRRAGPDAPRAGRARQVPPVECPAHRPHSDIRKDLGATGTSMYRSDRHRFTGWAHTAHTGLPAAIAQSLVPYGLTIPQAPAAEMHGGCQENSPAAPRSGAVPDRRRPPERWFASGFPQPAIGATHTWLRASRAHTLRPRTDGRGPGHATGAPSKEGVSQARHLARFPAWLKIVLFVRRRVRGTQGKSFT
jgi:hypothetical protein